MWFNFIKLKKSKLLNSVNFKDLKKKISLFNEQKITSIFTLFITLKRLFFKSNTSSVKNLIVIYTNIQQILKKNNLKTYSNVLQIKLTKKQVFCTIFNKKKILFFLTNGSFLKRLLLKKSQKKDTKVSILNLKHVVEFLKKKYIKNIIVNIIFSKIFVSKYIYFLKNHIKHHNVMHFYTPKSSFSKKKFKKIKSIKRKLKKKYKYVV
jgi:hypothetical protein